MLVGLGVGGAAVAAGLVGVRLLDDDEAPPSTTAPPPPDPEAPLDESLVAVGTRYLEDHEAEADQAILLGLLPALDGTVPADPATGLQVLGPQCAEDHATGDVVPLDGWVLSPTECRAAALYAT